MKRKILGVPLFAILGVLLIAGVALAAWVITNLTSTGEIRVVGPPDDPPPLTETYTVDTTVMVFGVTKVSSGNPVSVTCQPITVTNTGTAKINGIDVVVDNVPIGLSATADVAGSFPLTKNQTATVTVTLTGVLYDLGTVSLEGITGTLAPQ